MKYLVEDFDRSKNSEDLFSFWQQELQIRQQLRRADFSIPRIENEETLALLKRALYHRGHKDKFYQILFYNLNNLALINTLFRAPTVLGEEFLAFLPYHIHLASPPPRQLSFLINIYQDHYRDYFNAIIQVLDLETVSFLSTRSANPWLKQALSRRMQVLEGEKQKRHYRLLDSRSTLPSLPSPWGDKTRLIVQAMEKWEESRPSRFPDPHARERYSSLLAFAQLLLQAGLAADALAVLQNIYQGYLGQSHNLDLEDDAVFYRNLEKTLRLTIPLIALLQNPGDAYTTSHGIYKEVFPRFAAEQASLLYLQLFQATLQADDYSRDWYHNYLMFWVQQVQVLRHNDPVPGCLQEILQGETQTAPDRALEAAGERLPSLPHESYALLEALRVLKDKHMLSITHQGTLEKIQNTYYNLWLWLPHPLFINREIYHSWNLGMNKKNRREWEQVIDTMDEKDLSRLIAGSSRPDALIPLQVLWSRLTGVMN